MKRTLLPILLFLMLFGPRVGGSFALDLISFAALLCLAIAIFHRPSRVPILRGSATPLYILALLFAYSSVLGLVVPDGEFFWPLKFGRVAINYMGVYVLTLWYHQAYGDRFAYALLRDLFWATFVHSVTMIAQYYDPRIADVLYSLSGYERAKATRATGLTISYNTLNAVNGFALLAGLLLPRRIGRVHRFLVPFGICVIVGAMLLAGRTAALLSFCLAVSVLIKNLFGRFKWMVTVATPLLLAFLAWFAWAISPPEVVERFTEFTYPMIVEPVISFLETGDPRADERLSSLLDVLGEMYFLPPTQSGLLFGTSLSGRDTTYIPSDSGYVLLLYGIGIVGTLTVIAFYAYLIIVAFRTLVKERTLLFLSVAFNTLILLLNFKEQTVLTRHALTVSAMLLVIGYIYGTHKRSLR